MICVTRLDHNNWGSFTLRLYTTFGGHSSVNNSCDKDLPKCSNVTTIIPDRKTVSNLDTKKFKMPGWQGTFPIAEINCT